MKTSLKIKLTTVNDVYELNAACRALPCETTLVSGKYMVDAKSIMGIFSLNLSDPIDLHIDGTEEDYDLDEIFRFEVQ